MAARIVPQDCDVLEAARKRVAFLFDTFDQVVVSFSGGKDSLVVLELVRQEAERRGQKVEAFFEDEELIPDSVVENVEHYRNQPWLNLKCFYYPMKSSKFILGKSIDYIQWDPTRDHTRPIPAHGIVPEAGEVLPEGLDQPKMNAVLARHYTAPKVAFCTGMRSEESVFRRQSLKNNAKGWECFIFAPLACSKGRIRMTRVIYDWTENDVLKFIYENKLTYCALYDAQHLAGGELRVASALITEAAKNLGRLRATAPTLYQQIQRLFPEMMAQERYWKELDRGGIYREFGLSWAGIARYIEERITDPGQQELARSRLAAIMKGAETNPQRYTAHGAFAYFTAGSYKRMWIPTVNIDER